MRIIEEEQLGFEDVLIRPARSDFNSRSEADIYRTFSKTVNGKEISFSCIPICCSNMGSIATPKMAKIFAMKGLLCALEKHIPYQQLEDLYSDLESIGTQNAIANQQYYIERKYQYTEKLAISIGVNESLDDLIALDKKHKINIINIDVANGYIMKLQDRVREVRKAFPEVWIIAGTVVTGDIVTDLLNCGADIIRCGIGQGQQCLTRRITGVGRPTISMLAECSDAAHQIKGYVMNDGGCSCPGDVCKALGAADFTMIGSLFAGAEEAEGEEVIVNNIKHKKFAGMSSAYAQEKYFGGFKSQYRSSEGRQTLVKVEGPLESIIDNILGGIRSAMAYVGCHKMKHFQKHCVFYKVRHQLTATYENSPTFTN